MKIEKVTVTFSNRRHELTLEASLEPGESARTVKDRLHELAKRVLLNKVKRWKKSTEWVEE